MTAGAGLGLRHAGYHALDSLRAEKGYRHLGHDIGPADDPFQAALEFTVAMEKDGGFVGRDALLHKASQPPSRRQVFVKLDDPDPLLYHGESILLEGRVVGRVSSGAYGHTLGAAVGLGFVSRAALEAVAGRRMGSRSTSPAPSFPPRSATRPSTTRATIDSARSRPSRPNRQSDAESAPTACSSSHVR